MIKNLYSPNPNPNFPFNSSPLSSTMSSNSTPSIPPSLASRTVSHVAFSQDYSCFVIATDKGFFVYDINAVKESFPRQPNSSFSIVQLLFQCNFMVCVGSGTETESNFPKTKLMVWDDHDCRYKSQLTVRSPIMAVRLRNDRIVVVMTQRVHVYGTKDMTVLYTTETYMNDKGLCEVSQVSRSMVLVTLGLRKGEVKIEHFYGLGKTRFIMAHGSRIACLALTNDGRFLATASTKGTLVRVYNTLDGLLLQEVRRGSLSADIYSLAFSSTAQWLAVSSDKGTVHVFRLKVDSESPGIDRSNSTKSSTITSAVSNLPFLKGMLPGYFSSEWSVAQFRVPEGSEYIVGFGQQKNTVVIIGMNGSFFRCQFDPDSGGEMKQLEFYNLLKDQEQESV
ncbi:autophagy-related protein 18a-like [Apium graveolens]|uniref:autophagy-related protein 18a-like n=1 Tax=Apium graveolens TaxID=4045 RepID=UPI003D79D21D